MSDTIEFMSYGFIVPIAFFVGSWVKYRKDRQYSLKDAYEVFVVCLVVSDLPSLYCPVIFGIIASLEAKFVATYGGIKSAPLYWFIVYIGLILAIPIGLLVLLGTPNFISYKSVAQLPIIGAIAQKHHPDNRRNVGNEKNTPRRPRI